MANSVLRSKIVIGCSFLIALILQTIPWPGSLDLFRPSWLLLVTCYWVLAMPHRVNVGSALILGLLWDLLIGSTLGIRGMMMAIVMYIIALNFLVIRNMALWQQGMIIAALTVLFEVLIFFGEYLIQDVVFNPLSLWSALINCILWPWMFLLMRRVRRHWHVR
ncbi:MULTISPECIES: rod shape-determining protein MreD [Vibrio]|uniref:Rod shape-determining protein MreD n=1 Tax=Vibrio kanaloae TaxID=170673 RepID=A0A4U1ZME1_9VIBR|nr:rod shape-determining protein MreD [Vibrio kanaloae]OEF12011.1 rod shape-determining protein MreD [Vibrio kanaloae 5S-149]PMM04177.1 rod shape-determining protein MreD [Vibrio kanaloae]TKF34331.1 rod shape-determining protein MreD [Vibrio kanaloae]